MEAKEEVPSRSLSKTAGGSGDLMLRISLPAYREGPPQPVEDSFRGGPGATSSS